MYRILWSVVFTFVFPSLIYGQSTPDYVPKLDSIFSSWTNEKPGGIACVIQHGAIIYKKAFGLADLQKKTPVTLHTRFDVASNAKQFTAMCIALLEEQGKLSTDDELRKYYPDLKIADPIKIKNLIDHSSGLRDASVLAILSGKMNLKGEVRTKYNTKAYYLACMMNETDLGYPVGSELAYNNFNYVLLGDIVEKVSGQTLAAFADSAIFKPLGMVNTLLRDKRSMIIPGEAEGYLWVKKKFRKRQGMGGVVGDHNLVTTVDDLVKWQLNFTDNKLGKRNPALIDKVCTSSTLTNDSLSHYGYGLWISRYKGIIEINHGGDDGRHTSTLKRFPEHDLNIIVLHNSSNYGDMQGKAYAVAEVFLKGYLPKAKKVEDLDFIQVPAAELKAHTGLYTRVDERGLGQLINISLEDSSLYVSPYYYWKGLKLSAVSPEHFVAVNDNGERIHVQFPSDAGKNTLIQTFREKPRQYARHVERKVVFSDYAGTFQNKSTGAKIKVKNKGKKIVARKGIIRIPLIPFAEDQFYAPANDALFIFKRNAKGSISGFKVNAHDFRNFDFTKK